MDEIRQVYSDLSAKYDQQRSSPYFRCIQEIEQRAVLENAPLGPSQLLLDVGCGTGILIQELMRHEPTVVGLDYTVPMLKIASKKFDGEGILLLNADAQRIPFADESFDVVCSFKVLPHIPDTVSAVSEMVRVTKRKGIIIIEFYNPISWRGLLRRSGYFHLWHTPVQASRIVERMGLRVKRRYGARTLTPAALLFKLPGISQVLSSLESRVASTALNAFSGYYILVCEKIGIHQVY
jgi:ubiquinone/menaquinone biosynthesis C-methylase UbiE